MATLPHEDLFPEARNPEALCVINERCLVRTQDGYRVVIVSGAVLAAYAVARARVSIEVIRFMVLGADGLRSFAFLGPLFHEGDVLRDLGVRLASLIDGHVGVVAGLGLPA